MPQTTPLVVAAGVLLSACSLLTGGSRRGAEQPVELTYNRVYVEALAGDSASQNLLGYMHFTGESAPHDWALARAWFDSAASRGHLAARLNLALINYLGLGRPRDPAEAEVQFRAARTSDATLPFGSLLQLVTWACDSTDQQQSEGSQVYGMFCSGCHGWRGIAAYGEAPSFALGERMEKSDVELLRTIQEGHGHMPSWRSKLPRPLLGIALAHARTLRWGYRDGVIHVVPEPSDYFFRFGPMAGDYGENGETAGVLFQQDPAYPRNFCAGR